MEESNSGELRKGSRGKNANAEQTDMEALEEPTHRPYDKSGSIRHSISSFNIFSTVVEKWQKKPLVIGALEVQSVPYLDVRAELRPKIKLGCEDAFARAMEAFEKFHVRSSFINVAEGVPVETRCFGFVKDDDKTMKSLCNVLNERWVSEQNQKLEDVGFELDVYLWSWKNVGGKATTNIILIRFFELE